MAENDSSIPGTDTDRMDLHEFRSSRKRKTDNLLKEDHRDLKRFFALDSAAYRDLTASGGLDEKTKELLGLVASTVLRCNDCIAYHCDRCVEVGWKKSELLDALNVALVVGGSITIPHIRTVWEVVEQLYAEKQETVEAPRRAAKLDHASHELKAGETEQKRSTAVLTAGLPGGKMPSAPKPANQPSRLPTHPSAATRTAVPTSTAQTANPNLAEQAPAAKAKVPKKSKVP